MANLQQLKDQVADLQSQVVDLQTSVDLEQAQIQALLETNAAVVQDLNEQIDALEAQLADSASPEQIQEVIDSLVAVRDSIATTKADIEATVEGSGTSTSTSSTTETTTEEV